MIITTAVSEYTVQSRVVQSYHLRPARTCFVYLCSIWRLAFGIKAQAYRLHYITLLLA